MRYHYKIMTVLAAGALAGSAAIGAPALAATTTPAAPAPAAATPAPASPGAVVPARGQNYQVLATANLRSGPGTRYRKIDTLKARAKVTGTGGYKKITGTAWYWVEVKTAKGKTGWVSTGYLKAVKR